MCHSIRSMFRVLVIYNFVLDTNLWPHQGDSGHSEVLRKTLVVEWTQVDRSSFQTSADIRRIFLDSAMSLSTRLTNMPGPSSLGMPGVPWPSPSQICADQLALFQPRGASYAHQMILAPPDFQTFLRPAPCMPLITYLLQCTALCCRLIRKLTT